MPWVLAERFLLLIAIPSSRECRSYIIHFKLVLAAQNSDGLLNIFYCRLDFMIVLAG